MKKYCQNCGYEIVDDSKFCVKCGAIVDDQSEVFEQPVQQPEQQPIQTPPVVPPQPQRDMGSKPSKESKSSDKVALGLAVVALILSVAAISSAFLIEPETPEATVGSNSVGQGELKDNAVTSKKVVDKSITDNDIEDLGISKIKNNSILSRHILDKTIMLQDLATDLQDKITNATIIGEDISDETITTKEIKNGTIATSDLADDSVTSEKIKDGEVKNTDIATNAVNSAEIAAGAVDTDELATDAVTYAKMEIKIKSDLATSVIHGTTINHGLNLAAGILPTSIVVTPVYVPSLESGNAVFHANVYNVDEDSFQIALWVEVQNVTTNNPPQLLEKVDGSIWDPQSVYWIAIYDPNA